MGIFTDYMTRRLQSNPFAVQQQINNMEGVAVPQQQTEQPKVDTSNAIGSLADLLGPTPAEREAQQARLERGRQQMTMWTGLFDGLRQLGNLYYTSKGARPQHYNDPYTEVDKTYARNKQTLDDLTAYNRQYAQQLYALQRQQNQDAVSKAYHDAQIQHYKTLDEEARKKTEQQAEYNEARNNYYAAMASKNTEQAEYWRLRAQGVPKESAAKIAKDYAQAAKARNSSGKGGKKPKNNQQNNSSGSTVDNSVLAGFSIH